MVTFTEDFRIMAAQKYSDLKFTDDFLFCKILVHNPDIAKDILELILNKHIGRVAVQKQQSIEITADGRGIRLDVYAEENDTIYDMEMQTTKKEDLPERTRYYQGMIDLDSIARGCRFKDLKDVYVLFICMQDPFKLNSAVYTFKNLCVQNPKLQLGDRTTKVILNAQGITEGISDELKDFIIYLNTGEAGTDLCKQIQREVEKAKTREDWKVEYMTLLMRDEEKREEGRKEGIKEGKVEGQIELMIQMKLDTGEMITNLMKNFKMSESEAKEKLEEYTPDCNMELQKSIS